MLSVPAFAATYSIPWAANLGGTGIDTITAIATDSAGLVYVAGYTDSTDFLSSSLRARGAGTEAFVMKINPATGQTIWATYLGGSQYDAATAIRVDSSGNVIVAGYTASGDFPLKAATVGLAGGFDGFVSKFSSSGSLLSSALIGGTGTDRIYGLAIGPAGEMWVAGETSSADFRVLSPFQATLKGTSDAFVAKFSSGGTLVYSTCFGGTDIDGARAITVDSSGDVYFTGTTSSLDFPIASALQPASAGAPDAFVARLAANGSVLRFSTYFGGPTRGVALPESGNAIVLDSSGAVWIVGTTSALTFPASSPLQTIFGGGTTDAFVARFSASGAALLFSSLIGGSGAEEGTAIGFHSDGSVYVAGSTTSAELPLMDAIMAGVSPSWDGFVMRLAASGNPRSFSTYLGGSGAESIAGLSVSGNKLYVAGTTTSQFLNTGPFKGGIDSFIAAIVQPVPVSMTITSSTASGSWVISGAGCNPGSYTGASSFTWLSGTVCTITPTPLTVSGQSRWRFSSWGDGGTTASRAFTIDPAVTSIGINYAVEYNLTRAASPAQGGSIGATPDSSDGWYAAGTSIQFTASAASGYSFTGWTGALSTGLLVLNGPANVVGNFAAGSNGFTLTSSASSGTYTVSGAGCDAGTWTGSRSFSWTTGTVCSIAPTAVQTVGALRLRFLGWADGSTANPRTFTASPSVTGAYANYASEYALTTAVSPSGAGTVTASPTSSDGWYQAGTVVQLSAAPASGFAFAGWTGGGPSITMNGSVSATANFGCTYQLASTSGSIGHAGGAVTASVTSGPGCTWSAVSNSSWITVSSNTTMSVAANTAGASRTGTVTIAGQTFTITQDGSPTYAVSLTVSVSGAAWTASGTGCDPGSWTGPRASTWTTGSQCTITPATSTVIGNTRVRFASWSDGSTANPRVFSANGSVIAITMNFVTEHRLTRSVVPAGSGSITASPDSADGWYAAGTVVQLTASPAVGFRFSSWTGGPSVTMSAPVSVTANFISNCTFALDTSGITNSTADGRAAQLTLTVTGSNCSWTAGSNSLWLDIFPLTGTTGGTIYISVAPNYGTVARTGILTLGPLTMTFNQAANPLSETARFIQATWYGSLGRLPTTAELNESVGLLNGGMTRVAFVDRIFSGEEFNRGSRFVAGVYVGLLDRDPEYGGWAFQRQVMAVGALTQTQLVANFIMAEEYRLKWGSPTKEQFVALLYRYILLREGSPAEITWQAGNLGDGSGANRVDMAKNFLNSAEFRQGTGPRLIAFLMYACLLRRDASQADRDFQAGVLRAGVPVSALVGAFVGAPELQELLK